MAGILILIASFTLRLFETLFETLVPIQDCPWITIFKFGIMPLHRDIIVICQGGEHTGTLAVEEGYPARQVPFQLTRR